MVTVNLTVTEYFRRDETLLRTGTGNMLVVEHLARTEAPTLVRNLTVVETFSRTEVERRVGLGAANDARGFSELLAIQNVKPVSESRAWSELVSLRVTRNLVVEETFSLDDGAIVRNSTYYPCSEPYDVEPPLGTRELFTLTYPYAAPSMMVNLRVPIFGNTDDSETGTKFRRTTSNQLTVARGANWPTIRKTKYRFVGLTKQQRDDFLTFCTTSSGFEIGILDQENRQWRGVITSEIESTQIGRGCDYGCAFEFQGRLA